MLFIQKNKRNDRALKNIFVLITYYSDGYDWIRLSLGSFRVHFPHDDILVVNHSKDKRELEYIHNQNVYFLDNSDVNLYHGESIDIAKSWCEDHGYDIMTLFEPDCLILGRYWYDQIYGSICNGNWIAGPSPFHANVIHICPTGWLLSKIKHSFKIQFKSEAADDDFSKYFDIRKMARECLGTEDKWLKFFVFFWDAGQKNWYDAHKNSKAKRTSSYDFVHFWGGHQRPLWSFTYNSVPLSDIILFIQEGHTDLRQHPKYEANTWIKFDGVKNVTL